MPMFAGYIINRPTGVKIAVGVTLLVALAAAIGAIGLFGAYRLGNTISVTEKSSNILVDVNGASAAVDRYLDTGAISEIEIARDLMNQSLAALDNLGAENDPVLDEAVEAIQSFDRAVDRLVGATDVINQAGHSQKSSLEALDVTAGKTLSEALQKSKDAAEAAAMAESQVKAVQEMIVSAGVIQANAYRSGILLLTARDTGNSKLIGQAKLGVLGMGKHVERITNSNETQLEKIREPLAASYESVKGLIGKLEPIISDPEANRVTSFVPEIDALNEELASIAKLATQSAFGLNKALSVAEVNVKRAVFGREEAELAASTGRSVALMTKRLDAATSAFELDHSDENRANVEAILGEAAEIGLRLSRAGATDVAELFTSYAESFASFADATRKLDAALNEAGESSVAATQAIGTMIGSQAEIAHANQRNSVAAVIFVLILALLAAAAIAFALTRLIGRPVASLASSMLRLADGETDLALEESKRTDEIGRMIAAVVVFRDNAVERNRLAEMQRADDEAQRKRGAYVAELIAKFRQDVEQRVAAVSADASMMEDTAANLTMVSEGARGHADLVNRATDGALQSVTTVASAAEELTASISEIGRQTESAKNVVTAASHAANSMSQRIDDLLQAASRIGDVVGLIKEIAEQTDLLALNATIEAARGGEAGKGFAVVAAEVKSLASQTAGATEEIVQQVGAIQSATKHAVEAVQEIANTMQQANDMTATIASAVVEQEAATSEISNSAQSAAEGTSDAARDTKELLEAVDTTAKAAEEVLQASKNVNENSKQLSESIEVFLQNVAK